MAAKKPPKVVDLFTRKPVKISPKEDELQELRDAAIEELESILKLFREGQLNGFAMVFTYSDGGTGNVTGGDCEMLPMEYLGALDRLKYRINVEVDYNQGYFDED